MSAFPSVAPPAAGPAPGPEPRPGHGARLLRNPSAAGASLFLALVVLAAVLAPWIAPFGPNEGDIAQAHRSPSGDHWLGTNTIGGDVLSNLLHAGRYSLTGAALALGIAAVLGITGGLVAGYFRGWFESAATAVIGLLLALPGMIVLLAARASFGPSLWTSMSIVGVLAAPAYFWVVHASVSAVRREPYVDAARVAGLSDARIVRRHVLGAVRGPVFIQTAAIASAAIGIQAGLEFVGLGDPNKVTWGTMLYDGFRDMYKHPVLMVWPSLVVSTVCVALTLLGIALRDTTEGADVGPAGRRERRTRRGKADRAAASAGPESPGSAGRGDDAESPASTAMPPAARPQALLDVRGLRIGYAKADGGTTEVVCGVDLAVTRGQIHGLVGESGSGKSQTAFAVLGVLPEGGRITGGSVVFDGAELADADERTYAPLRGLRIAYVPQEPMSNLDPAFTIGYQLGEPLRRRMGMTRGQARARARELLDRVGIADPDATLRRYPHEISGGMAQRVLIAAAVSCDPDLLIADEPTTALDVTVQAEVLDVLRALRAERGMGVLLVTHNFGVVADLCDHVSVMRSGEIVESGPVGRIFDAPEHGYTRALLDAVIDVDGPARPPLATAAAGPLTTEVSE